MNAQQLAALLNGREYRNEITDEEAEQAKAAGLVAVFGASDDLMEIRGAIYDEVDCYDGESILIDAKGVLQSWDSASESEESAKDYFERKAKARAIEALWCEEDGYDWAYETDIPHEKFEIVEDGAPYCRGIVYWAYETDIPHEKFEIVEDGALYCRGIVFSLSDIGEQK